MINVQLLGLGDSWGTGVPEIELLIFVCARESGLLSFLMFIGFFIVSGTPLIKEGENNHLDIIS